MSPILDALEQTLWQEYAELLRARGQLTRDAEPWLFSVAAAGADFLRWREVASKREHVLTSEQGPKADPAHVQMRLARKAWIDVLKEAGLTPASVGRVQVPEPDDTGDDFDAHQAQRTPLYAVK